ncbi:MAG: hypothetical protein PVI43_00280 [Candidatus Bathyarchaeota archaeon]|jgi:hypothetical protein
MEQAKKFILNSYNAKIICPHCGFENQGWLSDPRGGDSECEICDKPFGIPEDIEVVIE